MANRSHAIILFSEQREDGVYRVVLDLSVLAVSALRCPWTSQESSSFAVRLLFVASRLCAGVVVHGCACNLSSRWFSRRSRTQCAPFEPHAGSGKHQGSKACGRKTCASSGEVWGGTILTGRTASTCSTFDIHFHYYRVQLVADFILTLLPRSAKLL